MQTDIDSSKRAHPAPESAPESVALYIHWPFCAKKCPYCDFNSHVRARIDEKVWQQAFATEIETLAARLPDIHLRSIFFGGGTPSLMQPETVHHILQTVARFWPNDPTFSDPEITLEANPSSVEAGRFEGYRQAGVNRLSLGIQSLDDAQLTFLGRLHDSRSALRALNVARSIFDRVSFDLIYALPGQTVSQWETALINALEFGPAHLSLYQLTIEEETAFALQYARGKFTLPDEDSALALFETTQNITAKAGLPAYEISNHAAVGEHSRHNLAYWQSRPYIGLGPGAHGRYPTKNGQFMATSGAKKPEDWLARVKNQGHGYSEESLVPYEDRALEALMMGLRLSEGIDLDTISKRAGYNLKKLLDMDAVDTLQSAGFLIFDQTNLSLTPRGKPLLNALLTKLLI